MLESSSEFKPHLEQAALINSKYGEQQRAHSRKPNGPPVDIMVPSI